MKKNESDYKIKRTPVLLKPYFFQKPSISAISLRILIMLVIQILLLLISKSYSAIGVIMASTLGSVGASFVARLINKSQGFTSLIIIIQGIFIGMLLPENYPVITVFFLTFIMLCIDKVIFSKNVNSWLNSVCVVVIVAWSIGRVYFPENLITNDILSMKNPCSFMIKNGIFSLSDFDNSLTNILNSTILYWFKVTLPEGVLSLLWDSHSIIPAFRFTFVTLISSIFLFSDNAFSGLISFIFLFVYGILVRYVLPLFSSVPMAQGDVLLAFCTSGTLFTAIFLIQWFGSKPITLVGKIIYSVLAGIVAFLIVGYGYSAIGMCYTVLICNIINLLISVVEERQNDKNLNNLLVLSSKVLKNEEE